MTQDELIIQVTNNTNEIKSMNSRLEKVENKQEAIMEIAKNVEKLAVNMEYMANEQKDIKNRITKIEQEPVEESKYYKRTIVSCIITAILGGVLTALLMLIIK